jgi:hypothetical protein
VKLSFSNAECKAVSKNLKNLEVFKIKAGLIAIYSAIRRNFAMGESCVAQSAYWRFEDIFLSMTNTKRIDALRL